jgi:hypothetical protein
VGIPTVKTEPYLVKKNGVYFALETRQHPYVTVNTSFSISVMNWHAPCFVPNRNQHPPNGETETMTSRMTNHPLLNTGKRNPAGGIRVDKRHLRQVMEMNPQLSHGGSEEEFQSYLEAGGSIQFGDQFTRQSQTPVEEKAPEQQTSQNKNDSSLQEFEEVVGLFIKTCTSQFANEMDDLSARRQQLDEEEKKIRDTTSHRLQKFIQLLDPGTVSVFGRQVLKKFTLNLNKLGVNIDTVIK